MNNSAQMILARRIASKAKTYVTAKGQATAALKVIRKFAKESGHNPDIECFMRKDHGGWMVSYEAGPYEWGIVASHQMYEAGLHAEAYYSFDLVFYDR